MEISLKLIIVFAAVILNGLSAGFFYAWSVSVIPGTLKVGDRTYIETMQSINREIINPKFFIIFFGSILLLSASTVLDFNTDKLSFWLMLSAAVIYALGTLGVTAFGNVPLNNKLDSLSLNELTSNKIQDFRKFYEAKWNRFHMVRTFCAVVSFLLSVLALASNLTNT